MGSDKSQMRSLTRSSRRLLTMGERATGRQSFKQATLLFESESSRETARAGEGECVWIFSHASRPICFLRHLGKAFISLFLTSLGEPEHRQIKLLMGFGFD